MEKYSMIISDFDGTLANADSEISKENADAIKKYIASGGIFAICTGRMMSSIYPHAQKLGLDGLLVAYQGAQILDMKTGKCLRDERLSNDDAIEICKVLEDLDLHIHVYNGDDFYTNKVNELSRYYEKICKVKAKEPNEKLSDFIKDNNVLPQKIIVLVMPEKREELYKIISEKLGDKFYVTVSADILIEVAKYGCDKSEGVKYLANYYNIPLGDVVAVGDNLNDITMIKTAGVGIAVSNAENELKNAADEVSEFSNCENAIAHIINKYGLGEN